MADREYHVLTHRGDARAEVERVEQALRREHGEGTGLHKTLYVSRADSTVVMVESAGSPLAEALRARPGWEEPGLRGGA